MTFTTEQIFAFIVAVFGLTLTCLNVWDKIRTIKKESDEPIRKLNEKVTELERQIDDIKRWLDNDKHSIEELRATSNMSMRVQFALLSHAINGNDIDRCKKTKNELEEFLATRGIAV